MKLAIVKWIAKKWLPGWKLVEPGYHRHKNPEQKKKVYREVKMEDVQDIIVEMKKNERYADEV